MSPPVAVVAARVEGAEGTAVALQNGELITMRLSRPFAPGTPFEGVLVVDGVETAIEGRASGSKRTSDGVFEVRARLVNLRKEDRERLTAALPR